jgi:hypothetical protein
MAAGATYTPIATVVGGNGPEITFTSIPSTYTDLILISNINTPYTCAVGIYFNNAPTSIYSVTYLTGNGSSAASGRMTSQVTYEPIGTAITVPTNTQSNVITQIMNYSNTTTYKTSLSRINYPSSATGASVGLWQSTSAINQITISTLNGSSYWTSNSNFTLYGIAAA